MKIFLSGKIDLDQGSWRDAILGMDERYDYESKTWVREQRWVKKTLVDLDGKPFVWVPRSGVVLGLYDYVGPFHYDSEDVDISNYGTFHGVDAVPGCHGFLNPEERVQVLRCCQQAIADCDIFFAYMNTPDAFGTLSEIGFASALGKFIAVLDHPSASWEWDDYWFAHAMADVSLEWPDMELGPSEWGPNPDIATVLQDGLKSAVLAYAARPAIRTTNISSIDPVRRSFQQIAQWTSDPRVRGEAESMLRKLAR